MYVCVRTCVYMYMAYVCTYVSTTSMRADRLRHTYKGERFHIRIMEKGHLSSPSIGAHIKKLQTNISIL